MSLLSRNNQINKLNKNNLSIKAYYKDNNSQHLVESEKNNIDNLVNAALSKKEYYKNNKLVKRLYGYDSRIEYTSFNTIKGEYTCPNCMMNIELDGKTHECPKCGSELLIEYNNNKEIASLYTYDSIIHNKKYIILTIVLDLLMAFHFGLFYFIKTAKIYNIVDIGKTVGVGLIGGLVFFLFFYLAGALLFVLPSKIKRNKIVKSDTRVWEELIKRNIAFNVFYNNLFYELKNYYFVHHDKCCIVDFDIMDYYNFKMIEDGSNLYISFDAVIREIKYIDNNIKVEQYCKRLTLKKNNKATLKSDLTHCHNCGSEINVNDDKCPSCGVVNNFKQEWYLNK